MENSFELPCNQASPQPFTAPAATLMTWCLWMTGYAMDTEKTAMNTPATNMCRHVFGNRPWQMMEMDFQTRSHTKVPTISKKEIFKK